MPLCLRAVGAHLEDGVLLLVLRAVPGRMLPGDLEPLGLSVQPDEARVHAAVHLGHQPRLQAHPARVQRHRLRETAAPKLLRVSAGSDALQNSRSFRTQKKRSHVAAERGVTAADWKQMD